MKLGEVSAWSSCLGTDCISYFILLVCMSPLDSPPDYQFAKGKHSGAVGSTETLSKWEPDPDFYS